MGLIERARFGCLPLEMTAKYSINRLIDSRNCFELIQKDFVIPSRSNSSNNHEHVRTVEQIVSGDKGGMIISPQIGLHENVLALDYDSEYANLIVIHNLSYETVGGWEAVTQPNKGLLPSIVERFLKRRVYFKKLLRELPKDSTEFVWCDQRVNSRAFWKIYYFQNLFVLLHVFSYYDGPVMLTNLDHCFMQQFEPFKTLDYVYYLDRGRL